MQLPSFSDWLAIAGLIVACIGFSITIQQLRRTASATEASNALLTTVGHRMQMNHLLVTLPQLHVLADELDSGVIAEDSRGVARTLVAYSRIAIQVASLLENEDGDSNTELIQKLRLSSTSAGLAKNDIVVGTKSPLSKTVKAVMTEISEISSVAGALASRYQMKVG